MSCCFLLQGELPDPGIELGSPALQADSLPLSHQEAPFGVDILPNASNAVFPWYLQGIGSSFHHILKCATLKSYGIVFAGNPITSSYII